MDLKEIGVKELSERLKAGENIRLIDVREPHEWDLCHIEGAKLIPLRQVPESFGGGDFKSEGVTVLYCHHGGRSGRAQAWLASQGVETVNLVGGIDAWAAVIDPSMKRY